MKLNKEIQEYLQRELTTIKQIQEDKHSDK